MSIKTEKTKNNNEIKITFTVEAEKFENAIKEVFKENARYFNVPGFRKGKAPFSIVEKHYGSTMFYEDAFNKVMAEVYDEEIEKNKLDVVSKPEIKVIQIEKGKELIFEAIVATKPEVELGKYKGIELSKVEYKVTDEDVEHELGHRAEHNARIVSVENRAVENGDIVNLDYKGTVDGVAFQGGTAEKYDLTIGSGSFIPGFEEQVIGVKIGEEKDINVKFPEKYHSKDLAGKDAVFSIKVNEIKVKETPKLDDEFAKDTSEFDTLEELKADIRKTLEENNKNRAENEMENKAIDLVCEDVKVEIPNGMIELEIDKGIENIAQRMKMQGISLDQYLKILGKTEKDLRDEYRESAEKNVKYRLVIDKLIEVEKIEADKEDVKKELENMAKYYGQKVEELEKNEDMVKYVESASKATQAVKFIVNNAKIK